MFSGQVDRIYFNLEQLESLASPIRSEVFWTFSSDQPMSVSEVARAVGKSAQTVHYHVNGLVEAELLVAVAERKRGARMEKLYVHRGLTNYSMGARAPKEQFKPMIKGFQAMTRSMAREWEALHEIYMQDPEVVPPGIFHRASARMTHEQSVAWRKRIVDMTAEIAAMESDPDGVRTNVSFLMTPTLGESRQILKDTIAAHQTKKPRKKKTTS